MTGHNRADAAEPGAQPQAGALALWRGFLAAPAPLRAAIVVIALEGLAAVAYLVVLVIDLVVASPNSYGAAAFLLALVAAAAVWLWFIVRGLIRGRASARSGGITVQLFLLALAAGSFQGQAMLVGLLFAVPAVTVLVLLFTKPAVRATLRRGDDARG